MNLETILDGVGMSFRGEVELKHESNPFVVFREAFGFIPNLVCEQSALPRVIAAHAKLEEAICLRDGAISRTQRERILLSIAADRRVVQPDACLFGSRNRQHVEGCVTKSSAHLPALRDRESLAHVLAFSGRSSSAR
jgi:hypothetical protein